jgi:hypothetical protein
MEKADLPKETQWKNVQSVLNSLSGGLKTKLLKSLKKNPDVERFVDDKDLTFRCKTKFAPLTSVDVERSFSIYKYLLNDRRQNLTKENIEMYNVIYYNSFLFE